MIKFVYSFYKFQFTDTIFCNLEFKGSNVSIRIFDTNKFIERTIVQQSLPVNKTLQPIDYAKMYYGRVIAKDKQLKELFGF